LWQIARSALPITLPSASTKGNISISVSYFVVKIIPLKILQKECQFSFF
jgi:hypothetical protein